MVTFFGFAKLSFRFWIKASIILLRIYYFRIVDKRLKTFLCNFKKSLKHSFTSKNTFSNFKKKKMSNTTLMMIKPDAVENGHIGNILQKVLSSGFQIKALKLTQLSLNDAERFYEIHKERAFFNDLVSFMSRGPIVVAILKKEDAVNSFRNLIGSTDPFEAAEGTIRKLYATSIGENAVHGSDSDENAEIESSFHFAGRERF